MRGNRWWVLVTVFGLAGCQGPRTACPGTQPPCDRYGQPAPGPGPRPAPFLPDGAGPPPGRFVAPPPPTPLAPQAPPGTPTQLPPYTPPPAYTPPPYTPPSAGNSAGPVGYLQPPPPAPPSAPMDPRFHPLTEAQVRLNGPEKYTPESPYARVQLDVPVPVQIQSKPPTPVDQPRSSDRVQRPEPPETLPRETVEAPPVDVPQFAVVRDRVACGQQPFPDGMAWLHGKGYRTALYLRAPGEDTTAARHQFQKHGLQYVSLEVAPGALTKDLVEQFNHIVADETNLPLFVCDRDSALAGGLWYLHFRVKNLSDEKALAEAQRLGFRPDQDAEHKAMLDAARALVASLPAQ